MDESSDLLLELVRRGGRVCPVCSYSLDGLQSPRCPECGEPLVIAIRTERLRRTAWIVGLLAWGAAFGLYGLFVPLTMLLRSPPPTRYWSFYAGAIIAWPALGAWMLAGRWFRRRTPAVRAGLALLSCAIVFGLFILTAVQIR